MRTFHKSWRDPQIIPVVNDHDLVLKAIVTSRSPTSRNPHMWMNFLIPFPA